MYTRENCPMNLNELRVKYIDYLMQNGELDDKKMSDIMSLPQSIFFSDSGFLDFVKENLSSLGLTKMPSSMSELYDMLNGKQEEEYDTSEEDQKAENKDITTNETTYNKEDYSKNYIKNTYGKDGNLETLEAFVYSATGKPKSNYVIQYGAEGDINFQAQIQYGKNDKNSAVDMNIGNSMQGEKGDCWLLSTLNSLSYTDSGKNLIKNAITKNDDGSYSIAFKGVNTNVKITQEELDAARKSGEYAKGDDDVLLFELGYESIINKIEKGELKIKGEHPGLSIEENINSGKPLSGGNLEDAIFLLTGKDAVSVFKTSEDDLENFDKVLSSLIDNPDKYAAIIGFNAGENPLILRDINGNEICTLDANTNHVFSIKSVDEDGITIVNPWDSSKEYKISLADARKFGSGIQYYALDEDFKETDSLNLEAIKKQPIMSGEANQPQTTSPETTPQAGTNPIQNSNHGPVNSISITGNPEQNQDSGTKNIKNMSLKELKELKTTTESDLKTEQEKYNAVMDGTDSNISQLKTAKEEAYTKFQEELKKQDSQLSADYDAAKKSVDDKQKEIDDNDKEITDSEMKLSSAEIAIYNAESKISTLENSISELEAAISSGKNDNKENLQKKLIMAKNALTKAKKEKTDAKTNKETLENKLKELKATKTQLEGELAPLKDNLTELEGKVASLAENSPELQTEYGAYKDAEKAYEAGKTEAAKAAKEAVSAKQKELNEIDKQMGVVENQQYRNFLSPSKLNKTYTLNGKQYMSLFSQNELDNFLSQEWRNGNYNYNSNCLSMSQIYSKDIMKQLGLKGSYKDIISDDKATVEQKAKEALDNGYPVVLHVSTKRGTRHFATAVGYRIDEGGKISFLLADNVRGVGIAGCGDGEYRHLITGYSTPYKNQNYGYRCMIYG